MKEHYFMKNMTPLSPPESLPQPPLLPPPPPQPLAGKASLCILCCESQLQYSTVGGWTHSQLHQTVFTKLNPATRSAPSVAESWLHCVTVYLYTHFASLIWTITPSRLVMSSKLEYS